MTNPFRVALLAVSLLALPLARAQQPAPAAPAEDYVRSHYTKYEFRIPMRDGKRLFTAVYVPKTSAFPGDPGPYPFLLNRTPTTSGRMAKISIPSISALPTSSRKAVTSLSTRMCADAG